MSENRPLALVTGASHGIGAALARVFAEHGHDLIVAAEDAAIGEVAERMRRHGGSAQAVQTDLSDPKGVEELDHAIVSAGRPLAAAALNAGVGSGGSFVGSNLADELRLVDLNVRSTVHLAAPGARPDGGAGTRPRPRHVLDRLDHARLLPGRLQRLEVVRAVLHRGRQRRAPRHRRLADLADARPDRHRLLPAGGQPLREHHGAPMPKDDPAKVARQGYDALMAGRTAVVGG